MGLFVTAVCSMDPIRLIRDKTELQGTCYFEFLPGPYRNKCWNDGSVYLAEDVFGLIESIIERHEPRFDHFSFVGIRRTAWRRIVIDLDQLAKAADNAKHVGDLRDKIGFIYEPSEAEFARDFRANSDSLAQLARALADWIWQQVQEHECITVLGI
ncbi:MAG: hypothetical protein U0791_20935 [Gemmataceae bacterium]